MSEFLNLKIEFNMMINYYDRIVAIIKKILLKDEKLVGSFYALKKIVKGLDMGYERVDACRNNYIFFYKEIFGLSNYPQTTSPVSRLAV